MNPLSVAVTTLLRRLPEMNDPDEPVQGSDAVDALCEVWPDLKAGLIEQKRRDKLAYEMAEALNFAWGNEMDRQDESRNVENERLGVWEKLIAKSVTYWPRQKGR